MFGPLSQPEMLEVRYSRAARIIQAIIIFWYMITWAASQMIGAANFVGGFFGMKYGAALVVVVVVVWFYCMFGGFKSVVSTDLGQFAWIVVSLIGLAVIGVFNDAGPTLLKPIAYSVLVLDAVWRMARDSKSQWFLLLDFGVIGSVAGFGSHIEPSLIAFLAAMVTSSCCVRGRP